MNLALHGFLLQVILSMILDFQHGFGLCSAGEPGYLDFDNLPETNFSCQGKVIGGYYADVEAGCQMFHVCTIGQKDEIMDIKFLCLNGTVFDQETRVCERVDEVDCSKSERFYNLNLELYGNNAVTLSLHEEEEDDDDRPSDSLDDHQHRTSSLRPSTTTSTTTTTSRPSQSSTTPSSNNYQHSTGYPQLYQPQPVFPSVQTSQSKSLYDDKNGGYHHQYIFHNDERNNNQATSYQLFSNQGVSSTTPTSQVHQVRYSSTSGPQIIHNEPSTVTPLFHTSSTIQTLLNNNPNGPSLINPIFHNHGIASTTEQYTVHNNNPRETSEYQDNEEEPVEHEERRRLEPLQSTNKGKVSKLSISPIPQQEPSRSIIQTKTSQTSQHHRISVNFLPPQTTIQMTSRTFYPTSRTSTKSQKSSNQRVMQQHIHVPPSPSIPNLKPHQVTINLSLPDIQKIVQNPPPLLPSQSRVIVTAKASVSDESGRPLNTSQLITLPLPAIPSSYDDYKEGDESFDPFYRDVPKIRNDQRIVVSSRSSRSPRKKRLHRYKRDVSKGNTHNYRKADDEKSNSKESTIFSLNRFNETEISSIVKNLRKLRNIFFATDFGDSVDYEKLSEPSPFAASFDSEEPPKNLGSGLRNDNAQADYLSQNVNSSTDKVLPSKDNYGEEYMEADLRKNSKEYAEIRVDTKSTNRKTSSKESSPVINRRNIETEYYDSQDEITTDRQNDKKNLETTTPVTFNAKDSEIEYYDNEEEISIDRSKDIKHFEIIETTTPAVTVAKELEIEYYDNQKEISNSDRKNKSVQTVKTTTPGSTITKEPEVEEYVYDPDEPFLDDIFTTRSPAAEVTTTPAIIDSEKSVFDNEKPSNKKVNDTLVIEKNSRDIDEKEKAKEILDSKPNGRGSKSRLEASTTTEESLHKIEIPISDADNHKSEKKKPGMKSEDSETKETIQPDLALGKKPSEELLETKSSSNRKNSKPTKSVDYSEEEEEEEEEKFADKERSAHHKEKIRTSRVPNKTRPRNFVKNKHIPEPDYAEDESFVDYEEERRLERWKPSDRRTGSRRKLNSRSRNRSKDYEIDDLPRSRSSSSRRSSRNRKPDPERERGRVYHEIGRRRKPISEELESEEPEYSSEDYYSEEARSASLDDDWYDDDPEHERDERTKAQKNKGLNYREHPVRKSNRRRENNRRFRDDDLDYDSREASTLSSHENQNPAAWSLEYPTSEELPEDDSQTETIEEDYTEDSRNHDDVTTSAEDLTSEDVTSFVEDKNEMTEEISGKTEKSPCELGIEEGKTEGILKFTDDLLREERIDETTEKRKENPSKNRKESPMKDMQDYVDDNYEPENYKENEKEKDERVKQNSTDVQEKNDKNSEHVELKGTKETESEKEESNKNKMDESKLNETKLNETEMDGSKLNETKLNETEMDGSKLQETTTMPTTTSTAKSTSRVTRSTIKVTARTTPPKLFKPLTGRRSYLYIPSTTTPVPVVIKRRISLVHPRPAKPPKSYNELAPKPVIRKKLLEARKTIIAPTVSSTTLDNEKEILHTTLKPLTTSEIPKPQHKKEDFETTSELIFTTSEIPKPQHKKEDFETTSELIFTTSNPESDDKIDLENKTEIPKINEEEKTESEGNEEEKMEVQKMEEQKKEAQKIEEQTKIERNKENQKTEEQKKKEEKEDVEKKTSSTTSPTIENFTNYPYLLSRLSTMATSVEKIETKDPKKRTEEPIQEYTTLVPSEMDTFTELTTIVPKSENLEPNSESTKAEVSLIRTSANQKTSKRTTNEPGNLLGTYQGFNCLGKEMYRFYGDKRDCRLFHYCSPGFTSTQVLDFKFVCEQGTHFDEATQSCRHDYKNPECTVRIFW